MAVFIRSGFGSCLPGVASVGSEGGHSRGGGDSSSCWCLLSAAFCAAAVPASGNTLGAADL